MKILDWFKGLGLLFIILFVVIISGIIYAIFNTIYSIIIGILVVIAVLALPYFVGKKYEKESPSNYKLKKIK